MRSAIELKTVFDQIQAAEKAGNLSPEEKKRLEESAAEKGLQALFKVTFNTLLGITTIADSLPILGNETRSGICAPGNMRPLTRRPSNCACQS